MGWAKPLAIKHPGIVGGIVFNGRKVLMIRRRGLGTWELPKGKRDATDVDDAMTAVREVREETGIFCHALSYHTGAIHPSGRLVDFYIAVKISGSLRPRRPEGITQARWMVPWKAIKSCVRWQRQALKRAFSKRSR